MTVRDLFDNVEVQSEVSIVYYDEDRNERIELQRKKALDKEIKFMYCENDVLFVEVEK